MKQNLIALILGMLLILGGCSSNVGILDEPQSNEETFRIYELISDYYKSKNPSTKSAAQVFRITGISTQTYAVENETVRSSETSDSDSTFQMQTVTLDFGETSGYAIVSDDPRIEEVYFLTENGLPSDTSFIKPLKDLFELYPEMAKETLLSENKTRVDYHDGLNLIPNITPFTWGQSAPYNYCAPYCKCSLCSSRGNHQLAGCVTTAVAQYLATRGHFKGTYYPNGDIDFSTFRQWYSPSSSSGDQGKIANFFREVAHNCQIKFGCDGSYGQIEAVLNYLKELGIQCRLTSGSVTTNEISSQLSKGIPVILCGADPDKKEGHMWLVTGFDYKTAETTSGIYIFIWDYYCNWGWNGYSNGWSRFSLHTPKNPQDGSILANYKDNLKYILTTSW